MNKSLTQDTNQPATELVEAILAGHPDIREAAAFSIKIPGSGEQVGALVVPVADARPSGEELRELVAGKLPGLTSPVRIVVTRRLPATEAGRDALKKSVFSLALFDDDGSTDIVQRVILVQKGDGTVPVFFAHGPYGTAHHAKFFARHFGPEQAIYALQWQEPEIAVKDGLTMEMLASYYVREMTPLQPHGAFYLVGHSFGAQLALEIAQQLFEQGRLVAFLGLIDASAHLSRRSFGSVRHAPKPRSVYEQCKHLWRMYVPRAYSGDITIFQGRLTSLDALTDPNAGWGYLAFGKVETLTVTGDHETIVTEGEIERWGGTLADRVKGAMRDWKDDSDGAGRLKELKRRAMAYRDREDVSEVDRARRASKYTDLDAEIRHYRNALDLNRDQPYWVFRNFAAALRQKGDPEAAVDAYREAIERQEAPIDDLSRLADVLEGLGREEEARECVERAAGFETENARMEVALAGVLESRGNLERAESVYRRAIDLNPMYWGARRNLSILLERQGRLAEAIELAREIVELKPQKPKCYEHLSNLLAKAGRLREAVTVAGEGLDVEYEKRKPPVGAKCFTSIRERMNYLVFAVLRQAMVLRRRNGAKRSTPA